MIARETTHEAFIVAVKACNPRRVVSAALHDRVGRDGDASALHPELREARCRYGIAVGKAALAMARGAGVVDRGVVVSVADDGASLPAGWRLLVAAHPEPDERSVAAAAVVRDIVEAASDEDVVLALISGGASALIEEPRVPLAELRTLVRALMARGAAIEELNAVRGALSGIKAGRLAEACGARIITLAASDVIGDRLDVIGSGPTIGPWLATPGQPVDAGAAHEARRLDAIAVLARYGVAAPPLLATPIASRIVTRADRAAIVVSMAAFAMAARGALLVYGVDARVLEAPITGEVTAIADRLAAEAGPCIAWGEPTLQVPAGHGEGGRAQQLALALAKRLRGSAGSAFVAGSDGIDGPPPRDREPPAGAYVDGGTWDAIRAAGIDPDDALARCDAGAALHAIGALVVTGPTGVNHADVVILG